MKKSMNKRAIIAATTLATSLILVACGNDNQDDDTMTPMESSSEMMQSSDQLDTSSMMESSSSAMSETDSSSESSDMSNTSTKGIENKKFDVSLTQAVDKFKDEYKDAELTSINIDKSFSNYVYEIEGFNESNELEMTLDAMSGEIIKQNEEKLDEPMDNDTLDLEGIVTPEEAMKAALDEVGSGYVKDWGLSSEVGTTYYEVDIEGSDKDTEDVQIDAKTGDFIGFD